MKNTLKSFFGMGNTNKEQIIQVDTLIGQENYMGFDIHWDCSTKDVNKYWTITISKDGQEIYNAYRKYKRLMGWDPHYSIKSELKKAKTYIKDRVKGGAPIKFVNRNF